MHNSDPFYLMVSKFNSGFGVDAFIIFLLIIGADITLSHDANNSVDTLLYSLVASLSNLNLYHIYAANSSKNNHTRPFLTTLKRILLRLTR